MAITTGEPPLARFPRRYYARLFVIGLVALVIALVGIFVLHTAFFLIVLLIVPWEFVV